MHEGLVFELAHEKRAASMRNEAWRLVLDLRQHGVGVADFKLARTFYIQRDHFAIFHEHGIAVGAQTQAFAREVQCEARGFGEVGVAVTHHAHFARGV